MRELLLLCEVGEPMTLSEFTDALRIPRSSAWRALKILELKYWIKLDKKGKKMKWVITDTGIKIVRNMQKKRLLPKRD